jgi:hypothetical protein
MGTLKFKDQPLWLVIIASWAIAFFEYLFQVSADRIGSERLTLAQLKVMQECITIVVFVSSRGCCSGRYRAGTTSPRRFISLSILNGENPPNKQTLSALDTVHSHLFNCVR